jgi:hypothetical protein
MRLRTVFAALALVALTASAAIASPPPGKQPPGKGHGGGHSTAPAPGKGGGGKRDFAVGGFRGVGGLNNVGFSAHSDANGANPFGHLSQTIPPSAQFPQGRKDRFRVTCLAVTGNHAAIGLMPTDARTAQNFPTGRVLVVVDNGHPVAGHPVDFYGYINGTAACAQFTTVVLANLPASGNISVHDAP